MSLADSIDTALVRYSLFFGRLPWLQNKSRNQRRYRKNQRYQKKDTKCTIFAHDKPLPQIIIRKRRKHALDL